MPEVIEGPWYGSSSEPEPEFTLEDINYFRTFKSLIEKTKKDIPEYVADKLAEFSIDELRKELDAVKKMSDSEVYSILNAPVLDWNKYPALTYYAIKEGEKRIEEFAQIHSSN